MKVVFESEPSGGSEQADPSWKPLEFVLMPVPHESLAPGLRLKPTEYDIRITCKSEGPLKRGAPRLGGQSAALLGHSGNLDTKVRIDCLRLAAPACWGLQAEVTWIGAVESSLGSLLGADSRSHWYASVGQAHEPSVAVLPLASRHTSAFLVCLSTSDLFLSLPGHISDLLTSANCRFVSLPPNLCLLHPSQTPHPPRHSLSLSLFPH